MASTESGNFELVSDLDSDATSTRSPRAKGTRTSSSASLLDATEKLLASAANRKAKGVVSAPVPLELPLWPEDKRGLPNSLARGALFTAAKDNNREYFKGMKVLTLANVDIVYK
ncbi:hypothetical protein NMT54_24765, partial [Escherichia coli]|nr:hypothetical protein [Escherichia coli]